MILKGLYNTKIDRLKALKYQNYMLHTFGILIHEDASDLEIKGWIIKGLWYKVYFPKCRDGQVESLRMDQMEYMGQFPSLVECKYFIKDLIKGCPERFIEYNKCMQEVGA